MITVLAFAGCHNNKISSNSQTLIVERQYVSWDSYRWQGIAVDVPIKGPQPLLDSIRTFLYEEPWPAALYDDDDMPLLTPKATHVIDISSLLASYANKYKGTYHNGEFRENIFLIAQTESFVTYGVEVFTMGCSGSSHMYLQTFSKVDGHKIRNIICPEDVARFDPYDYLYGTECGLMHDGIIVDGRQGPDYETGYGFLLYEDVFPYLSLEAQNLVKNMGEVSKWKDCFIGERLATVKTQNNRTIDLTVRPAIHDWYFCEGEYWVDEYDMGNNSSYGGQDLMAIYLEKDDFEPATVINGKSAVTGNWNTLYTTDPSLSVYDWDNYSAFSYDTATNKLYIPWTERLTTGDNDCNDRYSVYRFNGFDEFVYEGEDGGFWLHPSLRQFGRLRYVGVNREYLIRIDEMRIYDNRYDDQYNKAKSDDRRYRLAIWNINNDDTFEGFEYMANEPDRVIYNGCYHPGFVSGFVFSDEGREYVIKKDKEELWDGRWKGSLEVYQDGKPILEQTVEEATIRRKMGLIRNH
jgi:hypothetical protein